MRNLGEVICVKVNTPVLRRTEPTQGRSGFDIKGNKIPAVAGEWVGFKMGGTVVSRQRRQFINVCNFWYAEIPTR